MTKLHAPLAAIGALCGLVGCSFPPTSSDSRWNCCAPGGAPYPLSLTYTDNFLTGDTTRIWAFASSGSSADTRSTWELAGPAVFVLAPDSADSRITSPVGDVLVRATGTGEVTIRAVRANKADSASASFFVTDPSNVTLRIVQGKNVTVRVGAEQWVAAHLLDAGGRYYRGSMLWSSSDTNIVTLRDGATPSPFGRFARGRSIGTANVVVGFLQQRDTARIEVVP